MNPRSCTKPSYVSGGRRDFDVDLSLDDLLTLTKGTTAKIGVAKS